MKKLKRLSKTFIPLTVLAVLGLTALVWKGEPTPAFAAFTWNGLSWDSYFRQSNVYNKVGVDTIYANVYQNFGKMKMTIDANNFMGIRELFEGVGADAKPKRCYKLNTEPDNITLANADFIVDAPSTNTAPSF